MSAVQVRRLLNERPRTNELQWLEQEGFWIVFGLAHIPLGVLMGFSSVVATIHAIATLLFGLYIAISKRKPEYVLQVIVYIVGVEVLWRITGARVFWEAGKYFVVFILAVYWLRERSEKIPVLPLILFSLLLPSLPSTLMFENPQVAREAISYNLSGHLVITTCLIIFSSLLLTEKYLPHLYLALIAPVFALAARVLYVILTAEELGFINESNSLFSAGWGPNQVSAILGLGALFCFLYVNSTRSKMLFRLIILGAASWFMIHAILTFSRGGVVIAVIAAAVAWFFLLWDRTVRSRALITLTLLVVGAIYIAVPQLETWSEGSLRTRFENTELTGRDYIIEGDILAWQSSPLFGVGPGGSRVFHKQTYTRATQPHTEYTRLLAEHGIFGVLALLLLLGLLAYNLLQKRSAIANALVFSLAVWGLMYLAVNGFRLVAPAFAISLSALQIVPGDSTD